MSINFSKISKNDDSALMRRTESDIIDTQGDTNTLLDRDGYGPMSYMLERKFVRLPHKSVASGANKIVAICASTGGPKALLEIIPKLPYDLNAPVIMVQHMPKGFTTSLAKRLNDKARLHVKEAEEGEMLERGHLYIARGGAHMRVVSRGRSYFLNLTDEPPRSGLKPCADIMFESLEKLDFDEIICVVLTGMGSDGTRGIGKLSEKKNVYVIAQDEATSTVYGMPGMVRTAGITDEVLPLEKIADAIIKATGTVNV